MIVKVNIDLDVLDNLRRLVYLARRLSIQDDNREWRADRITQIASILPATGNAFSDLYVDEPLRRVTEEGVGRGTEDGNQRKPEASTLEETRSIVPGLVPTDFGGLQTPPKNYT